MKLRHVYNTLHPKYVHKKTQPQPYKHPYATIRSPRKPPSTLHTAGSSLLSALKEVIELMADKHTNDTKAQCQTVKRKCVRDLYFAALN